jgi:hypothetical protein
MIDVGDDIIVVLPRVDDRKKAVAVVMVRASAISIGQTRVAYTPRDGNGKVWFASRDHVFEDSDQLDEACGRASDLAVELGVGVEPQS